VLELATEVKLFNKIMNKFSHSKIPESLPNESEHVIIEFKTLKEGKKYLSKYYNYLLEDACPVIMKDLSPEEKLIVLQNISEAISMMELNKLKYAKVMQVLRISIVSIGAGILLDGSFRSGVKEYSGKDRNYYDANKAEDNFVHVGTFVLASGISCLLRNEINKHHDDA
jgi:hypothetical protein